MSSLLTTHPLDLSESQLDQLLKMINEDPDFAEEYRKAVDYDMPKEETFKRKPTSLFEEKLQKILKNKIADGNIGKEMMKSLLRSRKKYSKAGKVLNLIEAITGKKIKDKKNKMVSEAKAQRKLESLLSENPQALDNLTVDEEMELMSLLPQRTQARLGLGEEPLDDIVEMAKDMEPEEVAKNLELFSSIDDIFEYADSLDAKDKRKFITNLSDEDKI